jgi:hypothetical protein
VRDPGCHSERGGAQASVDDAGEWSGWELKVPVPSTEVVAREAFPGVRSMLKVRTGAVVATVMVVVSKVGLAVKWATSSRLSTTSDAWLRTGRPRGSDDLDVPAWKACSLSHMPTNCAKSSVIGPIGELNRSRSARPSFSSCAVSASSASSASSRCATGFFAFQVANTAPRGRPGCPGW